MSCILAACRSEYDISYHLHHQLSVSSNGRWRPTGCWWLLRQSPRRLRLRLLRKSPRRLRLRIPLLLLRTVISKPIFLVRSLPKPMAARCLRTPGLMIALPSATATTASKSTSSTAASRHALVIAEATLVSTEAAAKVLPLVALRASIATGVLHPREHGRHLAWVHLRRVHA